MKLTLEQFETQFADNNLSVTDWFDTTYGLFKELEALQQPKNCDGCRSKSCSVKRILLELGEISPSYFYCNDYEPKEQ